MQYTPLTKTASTPRGSIKTIESVDTIRHIAPDRNDHLFRIWKNKLNKKQQIDHIPIECFSQRFELLETEVIQLKDRDLKSRLQIKELENKIIALEDAIKGLTAPKPQQATPFSFGVGHKVRHQLKKCNSEDVPSYKSEINYDNILQPNRASSREHVGLFGSLGASSQHH